MEAYLLDWLNLLGRWLHLITGVAWIGASFYFVWLDNHLLAPVDPADERRGIGGEVWSVHGGGFYQAQKFRATPMFLPQPLHWFKWEAYSTWLSGIFLLALIYWYGAETYLIDPAVADLSKPLAIALGAGSILLGWLVYDGLCRSPLARDPRWLGLAVFLFTALSAWLLCQVFSGRGAYIHYGAMLGSIMVGNVFFVIMPGQRELVAACREGRPPDPAPAARARQRSVHNTYFTLPVLFAMVSNHYAATYGHEYNWLILIILSLAGALIRVWFVQRHKGRPSPLPLLAALALLLGLILVLAPPPAQPRATKDPAALFAAVQASVQLRCQGCHARQPTHPGFTVPPKGVVLESAGDIRRQAGPIHQQVVLSRAMPIGNLTGMTETERALIAEWYAAGAP